MAVNHHCESCGKIIDRKDVTPNLAENMKTRCRDCVLGVSNKPFDWQLINRAIGRTAI